MQQGYNYISDLSGEAQKQFYGQSKRLASLTETEVKSIILGSVDQTFCVAGRVFPVGVLLPKQMNPSQIRVLVGLNRAVYAPAFDSDSAIAGSRNQFQWAGGTYASRETFLETLKRFKGVYSFRADSWTDYSNHDIHSLIMSGEGRQFALTLKSRDYTGHGHIARATRIITMDHKGVITYKGDSSLHIFDDTLLVALITGWAEERIIL